MTDKNSVDELVGLIRRSFDEHVDGLAAGVRLHGIKVFPNAALSNMDVVIHVSPAAHKALLARLDEDGADRSEKR